MLQLILNSIIAASVYGLAGFGFVLHHRLAGFFDFSYAASFIVAPYLCWGLLHVAGDQGHLALSVCALGGIAGAGFLALAFEQVFRLLRTRKAGPLVALLVSLALYIVVQNVISVVTRDETKTVLVGQARLGHLVSVGAASGRITDTQLTILFVAVAVGAIGTAVVYQTRVGRTLRAVANDSDLSLVHGLNVDAIHRYVQISGGAVCGLAGICNAIESDLNPTAGLGILLRVTAAMVIGGGATAGIPGIMLGSLALGVFESFSPLILQNRWQDTIVFGLLILLLVAYPRALAGKKAAND
jgi:branched-subunit amino acid ABC-type transport system permease component